MLGDNEPCISGTQDIKNVNANNDDNQPIGIGNFVVSGDQNDLSDDCIKNNELYFPRCEYKARFKGTSAFQMIDHDYWGTYFRSTSRGGNSDRIANLVKSSKTYENNNINKSSNKKKEKTIPPSKTGCFKSPWVHDEYKSILNTKPVIPESVNNNSNLLYDQLLEYKVHICNTVVDSFLKLEIPEKKIDVYFENDYPCIMVQIKEFTESFKREQSDIKKKNKKEEQSSLYKIVIGYFIAITNSVAYSCNIPIELVNRASFGHNISSVTETIKSFRISIGIVPKSYAEVLARSLELLNTKFLVPLLNKDCNKTTLKLGYSQEEINRHNNAVAGYNNLKISSKKQSERRHYLLVKNWNECDNLFDVLCKVGDFGGRKVSFQITRKNSYVDLLTDYAHKHLLTLDCTSDFAKPLREILAKLSYENKVTLIDNDYNNNQFEFHDEENPDIRSDKEFWQIIKSISLIYERVGIKSLSNIINTKKIKGLYSILEKANLGFIRNSCDQKSEDGYGSSSDCEVSIEGSTFYSRKIIVPTGMRAINLAQFLSTYQARTQEIDTEYMYYETGGAVKNFVQDVNCILENVMPNEMQSSKVIYIDLNHCAASGPNSKVDLKKLQGNLNLEKVMVLDYTSASSEKINEAIQLFIKKVPVLLFVSSGIKHEQVGADMNPYGTLRIISTDYNELNKLDCTIKANLMDQEELPSELHNVRKQYKDAGAVVTSATIYTKIRGYNYQPNKNNNLVYPDIKSYQLPDQLKKIASLSFKYRNQRNNLTETYSMSLKEIITWDLEKIKFLGSDRVIDVINKFNYDVQYIFDQLKELYASNNQLTLDLVEEIYNSKVDIIYMDFEDLVKQYEYMPSHVKNKINAICIKDTEE